MFRCASLLRIDQPVELMRFGIPMQSFAALSAASQRSGAAPIRAADGMGFIMTIITTTHLRGASG